MILQRLRAETAQNHSAIESQMPVLDPGMSLDTYRQLLTRFWGYYAPLEELLRAEIEIYWPDKEYICSERAKVPNLERDLKALGESCESLECCTNLPLLKSPAQVLGCLYVIEGATLGGQLISKHLLANLGLCSNSGAAFFNGYGVNCGQQWQSFRLFITSHAEPMQQDDEIIVSANATFRTLSEWLFLPCTIHSPRPCNQGRGAGGEGHERVENPNNIKRPAPSSLALLPRIPGGEGGKILSERSTIE